MKEILVYYGKHGDVYWDATDRNKAYFALFKHLDKDWGFYAHLKDLEFLEGHLKGQKNVLDDLQRTLPKEGTILFYGHSQAIQKMQREISEYGTYVDQAMLYAKAKNGSGNACNQLLSWRNEYEYERWSIESVKEVK